MKPRVEQEPVAHLALGRVRHRSAEDVERHAVAAIDDVEQRDAIAAGAVPGPEDDEIGRHLDLARVARCLVEIGDHLIPPVGGIDREIDLPREPLVRARRSERPSARRVAARRNLDARDFRANECRHHKQHEDRLGRLGQKPSHRLPPPPKRAASPHRRGVAPHAMGGSRAGVPWCRYRGPQSSPQAVSAPMLGRHHAAFSATRME